MEFQEGVWACERPLHTVALTAAARIAMLRLAPVEEPGRRYASTGKEGPDMRLQPKADLTQRICDQQFPDSHPT